MSCSCAAETFGGGGMAAALMLLLLLLHTLTLNCKLRCVCQKLNTQQYDVQGGRPQGRGKCPSALVTFHLFEVNFKQMSTLTCRPNDMRSSAHLQVRWIDAHTAGRNITVALHPAVSNFQTHDHSNQ